MQTCESTISGIDVFGGNSVEFHYFMALFGEAAEKKIEDQHRKLT